jgi:hypothetical protein
MSLRAETQNVRFSGSLSVLIDGRACGTALSGKKFGIPEDFTSSCG